MKYFRYYPKPYQMMWFIALVITFYFTAGILIPGFLLKYYGLDFNSLFAITENSPQPLIHVALLTQGVFSLFMFFIPCYIFAYLTHPNPNLYLGITIPQKKITLALAIIAIICLLPFLELLSALIGSIDLGAQLKKQQEENDSLFKAFMNMPTLKDFLWAFLVLAIIPAIGEELFFRGLWMRFVKQFTNKTILAIIISAFTFAMFHSTITGFISIFIAGILLGTLYYLTGSLTANILAHLFFNGFQIILSYYSNFNTPLKQFLSGNTLSMQFIGITIAGLAIFSLSFFYLWKIKTPLPINWPQDFTEEEMNAPII